MKAILIVILLMGMVKLSLAQPLGSIKGDTAKSENTSFVIKRYYFNKDSVLKNIVLHNVSNKLSDTTITYMPPVVWGEPTDSMVVKKSIERVFDSKRIKEIFSEKNIALIIYLDPKGKVLKIAYVIPVQTSMTANELEKLDNALIGNVQFNLHGEDLEKGNYYSFMYVVRYKVLFKELPQ